MPRIAIPIFQRHAAPLISTVLALLTAAFIAPVAATATPAQYSPPANIAKDCSAPVTDAMNIWLDSIPSGTPEVPVIINLGTSCYLLNDVEVEGSLDVNSIKIINKSNWKIIGQSASLRFNTTVPTKNYEGQQRSVNRAELALIDVDTVEVSGLNLVGKKNAAGYDPLLEHDHNLSILGGKNIMVEGITAQDAAGDNISIKGHDSVYPKNVRIVNSYLSNASRHNISITAGEGITIEDNRLENNGYWGIDAELHSPEWPMHDLRVLNNTLSGTRYGFMALSSSSESPETLGVRDVQIRGNSMPDAPATNFEFVNINNSALSEAFTKNVVISGNKFVVNQHGISAKYVFGLSVHDNHGISNGNGKVSECGGDLTLINTDAGTQVEAGGNEWSSRHPGRPAVDTCLKSVGAGGSVDKKYILVVAAMVFSLAAAVVVVFLIRSNPAWISRISRARLRRR